MAQQSAEQPIKQKDDSPPAIIMPPQISSLGQCSLIMRMRIIDQVIKADPYILNNYFDDLLMKSSPLKQALFVLQAAAAEPGIAEQSVHDILTWKNSGYPFDFTELLNGYISFIKAGLKSTDSNYHYHYHKKIYLLSKVYHKHKNLQDWLFLAERYLSLPYNTICMRC